METKYHIQWLQDSLQRGDAFKFIYFWGHTPAYPAISHACLSQWYVCPFKVGENTFQTAEQYMMSQKALLFQDQEIYEKIISAGSPGEAKDLGRKVRGFDEQTWNEHRYNIVKQGNIHKFSQHPNLQAYLLQSAPRVLVEASPVDPIWGIGMAADDPKIAQVSAWKGLNLLGFALMEVRDFLTESQPVF